MVTPLGAARVHTEDLQEGHSGQEGESSLLIKPGREALMDGAVSAAFQRYRWAGWHQKQNQIKRVSEQVACFESCLA